MGNVYWSRMTGFFRMNLAGVLRCACYDVFRSRRRSESAAIVEQLHQRFLFQFAVPRAHTLRPLATADRLKQIFASKNVPYYVQHVSARRVFVGLLCLSTWCIISDCFSCRKWIV